MTEALERDVKIHSFLFCRLGYARVSHGGLSDTEVQMAKFRIPKDHLNYKDHDVVKTDNAEIKKRHLFNSK